MTAHLDVDPMLLGLIVKSFEMLTEVTGLQSLYLNYFLDLHLKRDGTGGGQNNTKISKSFFTLR